MRYFIPLVLLFLVGCSSTIESTESIHVSAEERQQEQEKKFISNVIESSVDIESELQRLDQLLTKMNVEDTSWKNNVRSAADMLRLACNGMVIFTSSADEEKYAQTLSHIDVSSSYIDDIYTGLLDSLETYDQKKFKEIHSTLPETSDSITALKEKLETERYE